MTAPSKRLITGLVALVVLLTVIVVLQSSSSGTRRVTAYFDRTVSLYKGSEVRVMGVNIGTVTAVVPEGDRVRVAMEYDDEYKLPADAKAAIVTPTLTADRFVQVAPAYTEGPQLEDNARIELPETGTPVELDRIYKSLSDLTQALGPNGANTDGSLNTLLTRARVLESAHPLNLRSSARRLKQGQRLASDHRFWQARADRQAC